MKNKTLYIAHPAFDISTISNSSQLLKDTSTELTHNVYNTSLGDLEPEDILSVIDQFTDVIFVDNLFDKKSEIYSYTSALLNYISHFLPIKNYPTPVPDSFTDMDICTRPDSPVIWVFGTSYAKGTGVTKEQKFTTILGDKFKMPVIDITKEGISTRWVLDHLLSANIKKDDIVIWELAAIDRYRVNTDYHGPIVDMQLKDMPKISVAAAREEQMFFDQLSLIKYGVAYLRALNVKFAIVGFPTKTKSHLMCMQEYTKYPEFNFISSFLDIGTDNLHPGPITHRVQADRLIKYLS